MAAAATVAAASFSFDDIRHSSGCVFVYCDTLRVFVAMRECVCVCIFEWQFMNPATRQTEKTENERDDEIPKWRNWTHWCD